MPASFKSVLRSNIFPLFHCFCFLIILEGGAEDGPRVVFMVDLWHPNVAAAERQALDYIFTPGRLEDKDGK